MSETPAKDRRETIDLGKVEPVATEERPEDYIPSKGLPEAVEAALILGRPLLITGEPGTGKTQLASWVAYSLGMVTKGLESQIHKFETKSTSTARDLFYTYDAIAAFQDKSSPPKLGKEFVSYHALGRAIIEAYEKSKIQGLLPENARRFEYVGPRRSVVLIDEIDKAPRDFPNDLLNEIDRLYFRIPEFDNEGTPGAYGEDVPLKRRPVIVITSNSEKSLPEPFLRRCVFHHIPFPTDIARLREIVDTRLKTMKPAEPIVDDALELFWKLRGHGPGPQIRKKPSTAELLDWVRCLGRRLSTEKEIDSSQLFLETIGILVKEKEDLAAVVAHIEKSAGAPG